MGLHRAKLGRRGMVALAATGALIVGGGAAAMVGTGSADPLLPVPAPVVGTTYVLPDLAPFAQTDDDPKGGTVGVDDDLTPPAPTGGGDAALRLDTPDGDGKAAIAKAEDSALGDWIATAAYSAYQNAAENADQFPSMQLVIDYDPDSPAGFSTLTYEPIYNATDSRTPNAWHRYEAGMGRWCSTRAIPGVIDESQRSCSNGGTKLLSEFIAAQPGIRVTGLVINQGRGNPGLDAGVDLVSTPSTTYDFELTKPMVPEMPGNPCEEPTMPPAHPGDDHGNGDDHPQGGGNGNGDHPEGGDSGHEKPDNGGHEPSHGDEHPQPDNGGQEQPGEGGHEPPHCPGS
ncbi:hypothetical protein ACR9E3_00410 [Actinomycetospora sp. C-140]